MSVLIADFDNQANDPVFTGSLEQALNIADRGRVVHHELFERTSAQTLPQQLKPGSTLDEAIGAALAEREGINVVLTGAIEARGNPAICSP